MNKTAAVVYEHSTPADLDTLDVVDGMAEFLEGEAPAALVAADLDWARRFRAEQRAAGTLHRPLPRRH
jgi:hypothetical protein